MREVDFEQESATRIGQFRAIDLFGDGSFFVLDTPGHAVGHLSAIARTTSNPDTFIFLGGDLCHNGGEIRPSKHIQLPKEIRVEIPDQMSPWICPGAELEAVNQSRSRAPDQPFFDPNMGLDIEEAIRTIVKAQDADADENVLFIYAHSQAVRRHTDLFPLKANDWKKKGWREKMFWDFLKDFKQAVEAQRAGQQ